MCEAQPNLIDCRKTIIIIKIFNCAVPGREKCILKVQRGSELRSNMVFEANFGKSGSQFEVRPGDNFQTSDT